MLVFIDVILFQLKFETAVNTRTVEMIGIVLSIIGILMSLYIFSAFP